MSATNPDDVDDPIKYFLEDKEFIGRGQQTLQNYRRVLYDFEDFIADPERNPHNEAIKPSKATRRTCMAFIDELRDEDLADSTIASYAANLHSFYNYMSDEGIFEANAMKDVLEKIPEEVDKEPTRRDISIDEMSEFIQQVHSPLAKALIMLWVKTGMRHGETINLDIRDINIDDPDIEAEYPEVRTQIEGRKDVIFVDSDIAVGDVVNGEQRDVANKRKRDTIIPIDDELKIALARWLAVRPDSAVCSDANPLFTAMSHKWGTRIRQSTVRDRVKKETKPHGWYSEDDNPEMNVTPHYFRHFFTTHMRTRADKQLVKYIRGDVGDDILDTYTHNWGDRVQKAYRNSIYELL